MVTRAWKRRNEMLRRDGVHWGDRLVCWLAVAGFFLLLFVHGRTP